MSTLRVDTLFDYPGADGSPTRCLLRVYDQGTGDVVLVVTDLGPEHPGASLTQAIAAIATEACQRYALDPARLTVVAHRDDRRTPNALGPGPEIGERFDRVAFGHVPALTPEGRIVPDDRFRRAAWTPLRKAQAEALVGQPLP